MPMRPHSTPPDARTPDPPGATAPPGVDTGAPGAGRRPDFDPPQALTTIDEQGHRRWVYPAAIGGKWMGLRKALGYFVIAVLFVAPWIEVNGMQMILIQIPERRFVLFGQTYWPQDVFYLVFLLIGLALALFFFTALVGRVWCGWLCPQTVFMEEVFRKIEEWVEGDHHRRRRRDQAPWSAGKAARKLVKHGLFLVFSALVSNTFLAFFVGSERIVGWMTGSPLDHWTAFVFMAGILLVFYFDFAWFREQFCVVLCPYARFQSVLTDEDTIQVGYDLTRGEPRGRLGTARGDCIDCHKCVAVCPTGIDIRDGFQLECIGCMRCIDACDEIMARIDRPAGLIRLDSLARLTGSKTHLFRPRIVVYSVLLAGVIAALIIGLETRPRLELTVLRPPGEPFALLPGGRVTNHFTLRLHNRGAEGRRVTVRVDGPPEAALVMPRNPVLLSGGQLLRTEAFVNLPAGRARSGKAPMRFQLFGGDTLIAERSFTFIAPAGP